MCSLGIAGVNSDYSNTKDALVSLQRLLVCSQCNQLTKNVCTLGNCCHLFCKTCVGERLGRCCPVCGMPAHARDAQVNRQLSNIVSLSLELDRVLHNRPPPCQENKTDETESTLSKLTASPAAGQLSPAARDILDKNTAQKSEEEQQKVDEENASTAGKKSKQVQKTMSPAQPRKRGSHLANRDQNQLTMTQLVDLTIEDHQTEADGPGEESDLSRKRKSFSPVGAKSSSSQTRVRSSRTRRSADSVETSVLEQKTMTQFFDREDEFSDADGTLEDEKKKRSVSIPVTGRTPHTRGRRATKDDQSAGTPSPSPSSSPVSSAGRGRSGSRSRGRREDSFEEARHPKPNRGRRTSIDSEVSTRTDSSEKTQYKKPNRSRRISVDGEVSASNSPAATPVKKKTPSARGQMATPVTRRQKSSSQTPPLIVASPAPGRKTRSFPLYNNTSMAKKNTECGNAAAHSSKVKRNAKGETPLHVAAIKGDVTAVRELLEKGDNPNVRDNAGWTPLHEAVNHGNAKIAELLLSHGALVNTPGMDNDTPLHDAVCNNRVDCVRKLVAYGASTSARNIHGQTPMDLARTEEMLAALKEPAVHKQPVITNVEPEDAIDLMPLCFLGTQLNRDQCGLLQKCASKLHAKVVDEYSSEVTHLVSWCNEDGQCPRTLKYLQAVLDGKWIVTMDWISICLEYGDKVPEEPFEIPGSNLHPNSNAPRKARLNRRQQLPGLFDGCQVYLHGTFSRLPPNRQELTDLLKQGGAHILTREPRMSNLDEYEVTVPYHASPESSLVDCGIFIVHDGGPNAPKVEAARIRSVPASWVVECIATFSLVEPESA